MMIAHQGPVAVLGVSSKFLQFIRTLSKSLQMGDVFLITYYQMSESPYLIFTAIIHKLYIFIINRNGKMCN